MSVRSSRSSARLVPADLVKYTDRAAFLEMALIGTSFLHMLQRVTLSISHRP